MFLLPLFSRRYFCVEAILSRAALQPSPRGAITKVDACLAKFLLPLILDDFEINRRRCLAGISKASKMGHDDAASFYSIYGIFEPVIFRRKRLLRARAFIICQCLGMISAPPPADYISRFMGRCDVGDGLRSLAGFTRRRC